MTVVDADDVQRFYEDFYRYPDLITHGLAAAFSRPYNALIHDTGSSKIQASIPSRQIVSSSLTSSNMPKIGEA